MIHLFISLLLISYCIYSCNSLINHSFLKNSYLGTNANNNVIQNQNIIIRNSQNQVDFDSKNWELKLKSPCKLNLFLRILGRRANGFRKYICI